MSNSELFKDLINEQLSSVEFVQDYLSLHFDGIVLTYYAWPTVKIERDYFFENVDYKNKLCELISKKVQLVDFENEIKLELKFPNECSIILLLIRSGKNLELPEFLYYHDDKN